MFRNVKKFPKPAYTPDDVQNRKKKAIGCLGKILLFYLILFILGALVYIFFSE